MCAHKRYGGASDCTGYLNMVHRLKIKDELNDDMFCCQIDQFCTKIQQMLLDLSGICAVVYTAVGRV